MADRIVVVNDSSRSRDLLTTLLEGAGYETIPAGNGPDAIEKIRSEFPDLVLLDVSLSGMDAFDICKTLRSDTLTCRMPVIIISPREETGLDDGGYPRHGADDYVVKPFRNRELLDRVRNRLHVRHLEESVSIANKELLTAHRTLKVSTRELEKTYQDTIYSLLVALEARDPYTSGHARKVSAMCLKIAEALDFDERSMKNMEYASILHDVGKIGVPHDILMKEGKLTGEEEARMRKHPELSVQIIQPIGFLARTIPIILHHHESYDGSGYPAGLRRDQIPLESRILAIVDAYHAMVSDRPYRRAMPPARAIETLRGGAGTQFDPEILSVFFNLVGANEITAEMLKGA